MFNIKKDWVTQAVNVQKKAFVINLNSKNFVLVIKKAWILDGLIFIIKGIVKSFEHVEKIENIVLNSGIKDF